MNTQTPSTSPKILPDVVTHLDLIKSVAVIIMIIDHIGFYFFPDDLWFRAIGRIGMPVWFFMVGYALGRDLPNKLLIGAGILAIVDLILFQNVFALNALVTIILLRLIIDPVTRFMLKASYIFGLSAILLTLAFYPTNIVVEYGTLALLFAIAGYFTRHRESLIAETFLTKPYINMYFIYIFAAFCLLQNGVFLFNHIQLFVMAVLTAVVMVILINMRPMTFPQIHGRAKELLQFGGRKTLEIYVVHLVIFKLIVFAILALK